MTPALERLAELVRQAEAKTRARKIEIETQHAAEQFRGAESRTRKAAERLRALRPASLRTLEQADGDEQLLKDLVRKLALYKSTLGSEADAEQLIATSQAEIERTRRQARTDLEEASHDLDEARRELRVVTDQYRQLRRELDRLQPELAQQFAAEDRLLWDAEAHFPGGQLNLLGHEVDAGMGAFGSLNKHEQYARLKVWIGRFRAFQASQDREAELTEELQALSHRVFHQLKWLSRQYEPGYIEAFRQDFSTDWAAYVVEAQEQLVQAIESGRRMRDADLSSIRERDVSSERSCASPLAPASRAAVSGTAPPGSPAGPAAHDENTLSSYSLAELEQLVTHVHMADEGVDRFLQALKQVVATMGPAHPDLLRVVLPCCELINGDDGLGALRRNLEQLRARSARFPISGSLSAAGNQPSQDA
ncbi:MAG: hypothetical protein ACLQIB_01550 [Isosphaeraceae bacterium]